MLSKKNIKLLKITLLFFGLLFYQDTRQIEGAYGFAPANEADMQEPILNSSIITDNMNNSRILNRGNSKLKIKGMNSSLNNSHLNVSNLNDSTKLPGAGSGLLASPARPGSSLQVGGTPRSGEKKRSAIPHESQIKEEDDRLEAETIKQSDLVSENQISNANELNNNNNLANANRQELP